jgi:hypothetical protein
MARSDDVTLVDVMQAVREAAANEQEMLATVIHLLTSGQVRLSADAIKTMQTRRFCRNFHLRPFEV